MGRGRGQLKDQTPFTRLVLFGMTQTGLEQKSGTDGATKIQAKRATGQFRREIGVNHFRVIIGETHIPGRGAEGDEMGAKT